MTHESSKTKYEGNTHDPSCSLQPGSPVSSDSDSASFKSFESHVELQHVGADSFALARHPNSFREPMHNAGSTAFNSTTLGIGPNQQHLLLPRVNDSEHLSPKPTLSEYSFHSFDFTPDDIHLSTNTNLLDCLPTIAFPSEPIFEATVDKNLFESRHPVVLDGYVQAQSSSIVTTPLGPNSTQKLNVPNLGDHSPAHSILNCTPESQLHRNILTSPGYPPAFASGPGSDHYRTPPMSLQSNSCNSFETALTTIRPTAVSSKPANKNNINIHETQLQADTHGRDALIMKLPNLALVNNATLDTPRYQQTFFANGGTPALDPQSPPATLILPHSGAGKPPPRIDPFHHGSLLTSAIHNATDKAVALFEATQWNRPVSTASGVSVILTVFLN